MSEISQYSPEIKEKVILPSVDFIITSLSNTFKNLIHELKQGQSLGRLIEKHLSTDAIRPYVAHSQLDEMTTQQMIATVRTGVLQELEVYSAVQADNAPNNIARTKWQKHLGVIKSKL